jgi:pimeloyl-ACP methyl ester carboxylesterase
MLIQSPGQYFLPKALSDKTSKCVFRGALVYNVQIKSSSQNTLEQEKKYKRLLIAALSLVALTGGYIFGLRKLEAKFYKRCKEVAYDIIPEISEKIKSFTVTTRKGVTIDCWNINPSKSRKYLVFCNGMQCEKDRTELQHAYNNLLCTNYGIIAFDYQGRGKSGGVFSQKGAYQSLEAIFEYLKSKGIEPENIGLVGHSMGCAVVTDFAKDNKCAFVAIMNPFNKATDEVKGFIDLTKISKLIKSIIKSIPSALIPLRNRFNNEAYLQKIRCPVLILHAKDDKEVSVELGRKLHEKVKHKSNIKYHEFDTGGHGVNDEKITRVVQFIKNLTSPPKKNCTI